MTHSHSRFDPRRRLVLRSGATLAAAMGMGGAANLLLGTGTARAADYKALVCVFLYGGNDGMNMVVPTDTQRYAQYSGVRGAIALPQSQLTPMGGVNYGLHPAMAALSTAWNAGQLAPVFNVGPLYSPLSKAQYRGALPNSDLMPDNLFSHADQQTLWETGTTDANARTGWGGRASEAMGTVNPVISLGGASKFGLSTLKAPLVIPAPGSTFGALGLRASDASVPQYKVRKDAMDVIYAQSQDIDLADAYVTMQRDALAISGRLEAIVKSQPGESPGMAAIDQAFAGIISGGKVTTGIGQQLYQTAKLIAANATVQGDRQVFFTQLGGFDMHANQVNDGSPASGSHAALLKQLADALAAFQAAMNAIGLGNAVTTFTQSDFGRTFKPNNSLGTDHAWGNTQLVMGGAVRGKATYGTYPELVLGGANDVGVDAWELQGRWIPTSSVDQYAATLLGWFGATSSQLDVALPNLRNFATRTLGFV